MPVEFSVAAYRLGHSMIRPGYRLNDADKMLLPIFPATPAIREGADRLPRRWARDGPSTGGASSTSTRAPTAATTRHDPDNKKRLQFAYRIDTSLVDPLRTLPPEVASNPPPRCRCAISSAAGGSACPQARPSPRRCT